MIYFFSTSTTMNSTRPPFVWVVTPNTILQVFHVNAISNRSMVCSLIRDSANVSATCGRLPTRGEFTPRLGNPCSSEAKPILATWGNLPTVGDLPHANSFGDLG